MVGSAESEHPKLTNREIIFEDLYVIRELQRHGQTTCRSNTALCIASRGKKFQHYVAHK